MSSNIRTLRFELGVKGGLSVSLYVGWFILGQYCIFIVIGMLLYL